MSGFKGGDLQSMEDLHKLLVTGKGDLEGIAGKVKGEIQNVDWRGKDANQFKGAGVQAITSQLKAVGQMLADTAGRLKEDIEEQRAISG